jgi:hypothetical protein
MCTDFQQSHCVPYTNRVGNAVLAMRLAETRLPQWVVAGPVGCGWALKLLCIFFWPPTAVLCSRT